MCQLGTEMTEIACPGEKVRASVHQGGHKNRPNRYSRAELFEVDRSVSISVDFLHHLLELLFGDGSPQIVHDGLHLVQINRPVRVFVEEIEGFPNVGHVVTHRFSVHDRGSFVDLSVLLK